MRKPWAEQAGRLREALTHYVTALQAAPDDNAADQRLREKILSIAAQTKPAPALPPDALRIEGRAEAAVRAAQNANDFLDAAKEYRAASRAAPWYAPYYFNLAVVLEKAGQQNEAIRNYKLYLLAAPDAQDSVTVQKKIGELEYALDREAMERARQVEEEAARRAAEMAELERIRQVLPGRWRTGNASDGAIYEITLKGTVYQMQMVGRVGPIQFGPTDRLVTFEWSLDGRKVHGTWTMDETTVNGKVIRNGRIFTSMLTGSIDPSARTLELSYIWRFCGIKNGPALDTNDCGSHDGQLVLERIGY